MKITIFAVLLLTSVLSAAAQEPTPVNPPSSEPAAVTAPPQGVPASPTGAAMETVVKEGATQSYTVGIHRLSRGAEDRRQARRRRLAGGEPADGLHPDRAVERPAGHPETEVRMGYDSQYIYFGVRCYDKEARKIVASSKSADASLASDDSISIFLDTFHDRRNGFFFSMNPIGAKADALIRNEGEDINADWDGLWEGVAARDDQGWTAEIAIPFRTLRFASGTDAQSWGFNVRRFIARTQESSFWKPIPRRPGGLAPIRSRTTAISPASTTWATAAAATSSCRMRSAAPGGSSTPPPTTRIPTSGGT